MSTLEENTRKLIEAVKDDDWVGSVSPDLIRGCDPKSNDSEALRAAAAYGRLEIVRLLLPVSDPRGKDSMALRLAAREGHREIVRLLLPVSDPRAGGSRALGWAARRGDLDMIRELLPLSDVAAARQFLMAEGGGDQDAVSLLDSQAALALEKAIQREVNTTTNQPKPARRPRL